MNETWTRDSKTITKALHKAVSDSISLSLQVNGIPTTKTRALAIHKHKGAAYVVIRRPQDLPDCSTMTSLLFKLKDLPILGFKCCADRMTDKLLAVKVPEELFMVQRRKHPRYLAPKNSMARFFVPGKHFSSLCMLRDISLGGARLEGSPAYTLKKDAVIGPATLSFSGYESLITREITLQRAKIVRRKVGRSDREDIGVSFVSSEPEERQLKDQLQYLTKDSPFPLTRAPYMDL